MELVPTLVRILLDVLNTATTTAGIGGHSGLHTTLVPRVVS